MPVVNVTQAEGYKELSTVNAEIQNQSQDVLEILISSAQPASSERGRRIMPNQIWQIEIEAGQTIYGKTVSFGNKEFGVFPI